MSVELGVQNLQESGAVHSNVPSHSDTQMLRGMYRVECQKCQKAKRVRVLVQVATFAAPLQLLNTSAIAV